MKSSATPSKCKFGQANRRFGLAWVLVKLATTSAAQISLSFIVMNLETALRRLHLAFLEPLKRHASPTRSRHPSIMPQRLDTQTLAKEIEVAPGPHNQQALL